jgi:molybdenum cofactor cytidylyltransferase
MDVIERRAIGGEVIALILLAAGSSSRMGQSKQLLLIEDEPLLLRSTKAALASSPGKIAVVLGAEAEKHGGVINHLPVQIIHNENWAKGMGNSIKAGLNHLLTIQPDLQAVVIMVCDQPLLTCSHLDKIISTYKKTKKQIVASHYSNAPGVPALFDQSLFSELLIIPDEQGAKKILTKHTSDVVAVDFPGGEIDLDTWEEYQNFKNKLI